MNLNSSITKAFICLFSLCLFGGYDIRAQSNTASISVSYYYTRCGNDWVPNTNMTWGDPIYPYKGDEIRDIDDLKIWGGVGKQLVWSRHADSRKVLHSDQFGLGHYWRHSYEWDLAYNGVDNQSRPVMSIITPQGIEWMFTQMGTSQWIGSVGCTGKLIQDGTGFIYQDQDGTAYHFTCYGSGNSAYYMMTDFADNQNNTFTLQYNSLGQVTKVTEPGGRFFSINYTIISAKQPKYRQLAKVTSVPAPGQWMQLSVTNQKYKEHNVVVESADGAYGNIAEVQVLERGTGALLTGKIFSSGPASSARNAFDGNPTTFYQSAMPSGSYVGLQFNKDKKIGQINILAAQGTEGSMVSQDGVKLKPLTVKTYRKRPVSISVISSVTTSDGRSVAYQYTPFQSSGFPFTYPTLTAAVYGDGTQATYTYRQDFANMRPLVSEFNDVRSTTPQQHSKSFYETERTASVLGMLVKQVNPATGGTILSLQSKTGQKRVPQISFANGSRMVEVDYTNGMLNWEKGGDGNIKKRYTYDANGFICAEADANNAINSYVRDANANILQKTHRDGTVESWTYNCFNSPTSYTDANGNTTSYNRDQNNHITSINYPDGAYESFSYNGFGQVVGHTQRNGSTESYVYDNTGLLQKKTDALGNVTSYGYDSAGRRSSVTDSLGNTSATQYNERGLITKIIHPDGSTHIVSYNATGDLVSETDSLGNTHNYSYDPTFHFLTSSSDPLGNTTQFGYLADSPECETHPQSRTLPSGKTSSSTYDKNWNMVSTCGGVGSDAASSTWTYDEANNPVQITDGDGNKTTIQYDKRHRKIASTDAMGYTTRWSYDAAGNVAFVTLPDGGVITKTYDKMNRLVSSTDPMGNVTKMNYDTAGNLASMTDPNGNTYKYHYDGLNRRTEMVYPDGTKEKFGYDVVGNLVTYVTRAGQVKTSVFNSCHKEVQSSWSDNTPSVARTYDAVGRLLTESNSVSSSTYTYDAAGHLLSETQAAAGQPSRTVSYTYDTDGNKLTVVYPSGFTVSYAYTSRNKVQSISADGSTVASFVYDGSDNRVSKTLENGSTTLYTYNAANQLTGIGNTVAGYGYTLDPVGRKTSRSEATPSGSLTDQYSYDADGQVLGVAYGGGRTVQYNYDPSGNRSSVTDGGNSSAYTVNVINQYTGIGSKPISSDGNGNLTSSGSDSFSYDARNRLTKAQTGSGVVKMQYDSSNRVVSRTIKGKTTYFVYDGWNLIEEYDSSGNLLSRYVQGPQTDETLARITSTGAYYYLQDGNNNVVAISDGTGNAVERYSYDVYGTPSIKDGSGNALHESSVGNRFMFTGREYVSQMGLYDYRNRVYSPSLGRFMQTDPASFNAGDVNIYRYCDNNPINGTDPTGKYALILSSTAFWSYLDIYYNLESDDALLACLDSLKAIVWDWRSQDSYAHAYEGAGFINSYYAPGFSYTNVVNSGSQNSIFGYQNEIYQAAMNFFNNKTLYANLLYVGDYAGFGSPNAFPAPYGVAPGDPPSSDVNTNYYLWNYLINYGSGDGGSGDGGSGG